MALSLKPALLGRVRLRLLARFHLLQRLLCDECGCTRLAAQANRGFHSAGAELGALGWIGFDLDQAAFSRGCR